MKLDKRNGLILCIGIILMYVLVLNQDADIFRRGTPPIDTPAPYIIENDSIYYSLEKSTTGKHPNDVEMNIDIVSLCEFSYEWKDKVLLLLAILLTVPQYVLISEENDKFDVEYWCYRLATMVSCLAVWATIVLNLY